ncbi:MAG: Ig-like domain-containing protein [Myxococcales bacterium]|nr:Ig-like domain-containing protein [Myxococcales bacterium]
MSRASWLLLLLGCAGCDIPIEQDLGSGPVAVSTEPTEGAVGVDRAGPFRVRFDRPLYPRDLHRGHVRIQSGSTSVFLSPWFEPVDRALHVELLGDPLEPNVRYRMVVEGIRDLSLVPMADPVEVVFETGSEAVGAAPRTETWAAVAPILARCSPCHGGAEPALGLDLSSPEGVERTAIGVVAEGSRIGTQADQPWHGTSTLDGLARIDVVGGVGRPAQSYLLYVLLEEDAGHATPLADPPSEDELRALSWWIRAGAPGE